MTTKDATPPYLSPDAFMDEATPVHNAIAHGIPPQPDDVPEHYRIALAEKGVKELRGSDYHPRILEYFAATSLGVSGALRLGGDETAWCSAFACWCMEQSGRKSPHRANARSWLPWGIPIAENELMIGDVIVLWRGSPESAHGHVAFYAGALTDKMIWLLGGNQHNCVSFSAYPRDRILARRRSLEP